MRQLRRHTQLEAIIQPLVEGFGCVLVGIEYVPQSRQASIRVYIDKAGGVTVDDCGKVSRQINFALGAERQLPAYTLEVSSPGMDRLLFSSYQFAEQHGKRVTIRLVVPKEGRKQFTGVIEEVTQDEVYLSMDQQKIAFAFVDIDQARLVPEW